VGIARTYQGEFLNGPEQTESSNENNGPTFGMGNMRPDNSNGPHLNPDGERALKQALVTIGRAKPLDHRLLGETLVSLGDWYLAAGALPRSVEVYRGAWKELEQANATEMLQTPQQIAYKPPSSSAKRSTLDPEEATHNFVEVSFTVSREGQVKDVVVVNSDAPDALQRAVQSSVKKARYRPRFEHSEAVDTSGVTLREELLLRAKKEAEQKS
jgi:TonB family protein